MSQLSIAALYVYPVKSCAGIRLQAGELVQRGLRYDRQWMVVDADHQFITQREMPQMALIGTALSADRLTLSAPDMPPLHIPLAEHDGEKREVVVWQDTCQAIDEGETAARWLQQLLGSAARLVRMAEAFVRLTSTDYTDTPGPVSFADGYPLLFISEGSLQDLNARLVARGKAPVLMDRFRPNVVVAGGEPYAEDAWRRIQVNQIAFDVVKPCARCAITTVDQATGLIPDVREPLATLATYRRGRSGGVMFGQNVLHRASGTLRVGDPVEILHDLS